MKVLVTAYPYAITSGYIEVPDKTDNVKAYIDEHFDDIEFGEPDLDYCGTDYDFDIDE